MKRKSLRNKRRGKTVLLWAVVLYGVAQLGINLMLDCRWPHLRSVYLTNICGLMTRLTSAPDVLILGTSRFGMAVSASEVETNLRSLTGERVLTVFNASVAAGDYVTADFIMRGFIKQGKCPSVVVIEVCPEMVARRNHWLGEHVL